MFPRCLWSTCPSSSGTGSTPTRSWMGPIGRELLAAFSAKGDQGSGLLGKWISADHQQCAAHRESRQDLKGIKLRTMENKVHLAAFRAFGASPTPMAWSEVYTALQQKTIDGQENPIAIIHDHKLAEVQKYLALTGHFYSPVPPAHELKNHTAPSPKTFRRSLPTPRSSAPPMSEISFATPRQNSSMI